jgi:hypothetical protein
MESSKEIGRELNSKLVTVFPDAIRPCTKNRLVRSVARIVQFGLLSMRRIQGSAPYHLGYI